MNLRRVTGKTPQRKIAPHLSPFEIRVIIDDVSEVSISVSKLKNHVKNIFPAVQQKHQLLVQSAYPCLSLASQPPSASQCMTFLRWVELPGLYWFYVLLVSQMRTSQIEYFSFNSVNSYLVDRLMANEKNHGIDMKVNV